MILLAGWRVRRLLDEIRRLDRDEAPDGAYDAMFAALDAAARSAWSEGYLDQIRESLLFGEGRSREWFLCFLTKRLDRPRARAILEEIAGDDLHSCAMPARRILRLKRL
jgi:hypothetical protein